MPADPLIPVTPLVPAPPLLGGQGLSVVSGRVEGGAESGFPALLMGEGAKAALPEGMASTAGTKPVPPLGAPQAAVVTQPVVPTDPVQTPVEVSQMQAKAAGGDAPALVEDQADSSKATQDDAEDQAESAPTLAAMPLPVPVPVPMAPAPRPTPPRGAVEAAGPVEPEVRAAAASPAPPVERGKHMPEQISLVGPQPDAPAKVDPSGRQAESGDPAEAGPDATPALAPTSSRDAMPNSPARAEASPVIAAASPRFGEELGIAIARHASRGPEGSAETLTVRLDPPEHGRIEVRLHFEDGGPLRAVVAASNASTLDLLRRDSADLARALAQAGVSTDAQSFSFGSQSGQGQQSRPDRASPPYPDLAWREDMAEDAILMSQPQRVRTSGSLNLIA